MRIALTVLVIVLCVAGAVYGAELAEEVSKSAGWKDVLLGIVGVAITALAGTGIKALVTWISAQKFVKKLHLEALVEKIGELAIHYAENLGRKLGAKGVEKLNIAKERLMSELKKQGISIDNDSAEKLLESIFNKVKDIVEKPTKGGSE